MQARMRNPAFIVPEALPALYAIGATAKKGNVPTNTLGLVHLRVSQINGCAYCVDMHARELKKGGETDQRIFSVSTWGDAPFFTDAERAALALTEAATRMSDRSDPVPDSVWSEAARHFDEGQLATLVLNISLTNFWNRMNVTTRQVAGTTPA
jgi:AhpD family alkylhydroperoxidase